MNAQGWLEAIVYLILLVGLAVPLGRYMARVYEGKRVWLERPLGWLERLIYRACGVDSKSESTWISYAAAVMIFNLLGIVAVYKVLRLQHWLPLNPQNLPAVPPELAFNTAVSFGTNTNWQAYGGETTLSYLSQMIALTVQNFVSAATGLAVLAALVRGLTRRQTNSIGNFTVDLVRGTLYILLPLSVVLALALVSQGVVQTLSPYAEVKSLEGGEGARQVLALGPAASQVAIKQLGTNGGGFFNVNSAHPFENPTPLSNFLEAFAILIIAAGCCVMFGTMIKDSRQGFAVLAAMLVLFVPLLVVCGCAEQAGNPRLRAVGVDDTAGGNQPGGNMEGKEARFGIVASALWATATTAASNGSVNSMHDSYTPIGGLVPMWLMQLGEVIFGGVGSGLYGMLVFAIVAVFIAGLMVGRTPEYLGKKIEAFEMKMASLVILIPPAVVLIGTAVSVLGPGLEFTDVEGKLVGLLTNPGAHGFSEVLYGYSSAGNNNGSAFGGLNANVPFHNLAMAVAMFLARYWPLVPVLAIAGSLAKKKHTPPTAGTLPTHGPLFIVLLVGIVVLVGALTFVPALALGPIVEQLEMVSG